MVFECGAFQRPITGAPGDLCQSREDAESDPAVGGDTGTYSSDSY